MLSFMFKGKEKNSYGKNEQIMLFLMRVSFLVGLIISLRIAYFTVDFNDLLSELSKNLTNFEIINVPFVKMNIWYAFTIIALVLAMFLGIIYGCLHKNNENSNHLTGSETVFLFIEIILVSQIVLPALVIVSVLLFAIIYLLIIPSLLLNVVLGYIVYYFIRIIEKIGMDCGITMIQGEFIGADKFFLFLTSIIYAILIPYMFALIIRLFKKILGKIVGKITGSSQMTMLFPWEKKIFSINVLRYIIYIILFLTSIAVYSIDMSGNNSILPLFKEALLEFVVLDTVIYTIYCNAGSRKKRLARRYYIPYKYDLEFVLSAIATHRAEYGNVRAGIIYSDNKNPKIKGKGSNKQINALLIDLSDNKYSVDELEIRLKNALNCILEIMD